MRAHVQRIDVPDHVRVAYLSPWFPEPPPSIDGHARGGAVRFVHMAQVWPHDVRRFSILYAASSAWHPHMQAVLDAARARGVSIVWNQNGVFYPAWFPTGWQRENAVMARARNTAHVVVNQSAFCLASADRYLGPHPGRQIVLHNAVDIALFAPAAKPPLAEAFVLFAIASSMPLHRYRMECAIRTVALLRAVIPPIRLMMPGFDDSAASRAARTCAEALARSCDVMDRVELLPAFSQREAPGLLNRAHVLLHPTYNDACPTLVCEALACGLPVVHSNSGGVPELVGAAGAAVPAPLDYERMHPPAAADLAAAVLRVTGAWPELSLAAVARARTHLSLAAWLDEHQRIFDELIAERRPAQIGAPS